MEIAITIAICWVAFFLGIAILAVGIQIADFLDSKSRYYVSKSTLLDDRWRAKCDKCGR